MEEKQIETDEKVETQCVESIVFLEVFKVLFSFVVGLVLKSWWENSSYKPKWDNWWRKNEK